MVWFLLIAALLVLLILEVRIWRALAKLAYRTGRLVTAPTKQKDGKL